MDDKKTTSGLTQKPDITDIKREEASVSPVSYSYADAGVSIDAGNKLVRSIGALAKVTARKGASSILGGFGGLFDLKAEGFTDPLLIAANDGVGTKLKLAIEYNRHDDVGIDLVAMCVNDVIVQGAEPLFFLDYFATAKLDNDVARRVIAGIANGCQMSGAALIGGETAEMPGMYAPGDYDLAGFCVGAVERENLLTGAKVSEDDIIIGIGSSGVHSNGFSLIRRLAADRGWNMENPMPYDGLNNRRDDKQDETAAASASNARDPDAERALIDRLLEPTILYVKPLLPLLKAHIIHGLAHITGGGLLENIPRVLPENCHAHIEATRFPLPPLMQFLQAEGNITAGEMARTFNCGIGMALISKPEHAENIIQSLTKHGLNAYQIGKIEAGIRGCTLSGTAGQWHEASNWRISHDAP